jgi:hypothetical protein
MVSLKRKLLIIGIIIVFIMIIFGGIIMITPVKPLIAKKEIVLPFNVKDIWNIVGDNKNYSWRSDISRVEIVEDEKIWIEYYDADKKYFSTFTLTEKVADKKYAFDMDNKNYYGKWIGEFEEINQHETKCMFTEEIYIKNKLMNFLAKYFWNLEKIQNQYFADLEKKLESEK